MREIPTDKGLVAKCGLYCGACQAYLKEKCQGCENNAKASWCKIRSCCMQSKIASCADCAKFKEPKECRKYNNLISKLFGIVFRSDRAACVKLIKEKGYEGYAKHMAENKIHTIKK